MLNRRVALLASLIVFAGVGSGWTARADGIINATESAYIANYGEFVVCAPINGLPSPATVLAVVGAVVEDGFAPDSAVDIVNGSVLAFCDQHWSLLQRVGQMARGERL